MVFTSDWRAAGSIAGTEVITKIFLYYFHERAWAVSSWGHLPQEPEEHKPTLTEAVLRE